MSGNAFPIPSVTNLDEVAAFYGRLGFIQAYAFPPDGPPDFVTLGRASSMVGIARRSEDDPERFSYWIYVDDVDVAVASLRDDGASIVLEPRNEPWGERVASVRDPAGNVVHLGAPSPPAD